MDIESLKIEIEKEKLGKSIALLNAHNPLNVLNKGYSIITNTKGAVISSINEIKKEATVKIKLKDGEVTGSFKAL